MSSDIAQTIDDFFGQYRLQKYNKGQVLMLSGDTVDQVYHLVSGRVKQYDITYRGDEIILNVFKPPAFFPMSLILNESPNLYTLEAETDIEIHRVPADDVVAFLEKNPDIVLDLLRRVYRGLDGLLGRMSHLMASSAKGRLMFEILIACRRFGEKTDNGGWRMVMNETDLAARAGLSRETVSREIKKLITDDLVTLRSGTITIQNIAAFEAKLGTVV